MGSIITWRTPLVQAAWRDIDPPREATRRAMVANALWAVGLSAGVPATKRLFKDLLGPPPRGGAWDLDQRFRVVYKPDGMLDHTEGCSTCSLVAAGLLGRLIKLPWAGQPAWDWKRLDSFSRMTQLGIDWQCKVLPGSGRRPKPGDLLCVGSGTGTHMRTITVAADDDLFHSVDGGSEDEKNSYLQCVKECIWVWQDVPGGAKAGAKPVQYWLDLDGMEEDIDPWVVPEGWEALEVEGL